MKQLEAVRSAAFLNLVVRVNSDMTAQIATILVTNSAYIWVIHPVYYEKRNINVVSNCNKPFENICF